MKRPETKGGRNVRAFPLPDEFVDLIADEGPIIYFAHPTSTYGTEYERLAIKALEGMGLTVLNPGAPWVQKSFEAYRALYPEKYMGFFKLLCDACDMCAVMLFPANLPIEGLTAEARRFPSLGAGVLYEVETFFKRNAPVRQLIYCEGAFLTTPLPEYGTLNKLSIEQTRAVLKIFRPR